MYIGIKKYTIPQKCAYLFRRFIGFIINVQTEII